MKDLPVNEEYIKDYCLHHELNRPHVNITRFCVLVLCAVALAVITAYSFYYLAGISFWLSVEFVILLLGLCYARRLLVFVIRCYQNYASESVRRQCSCMPSCSEYALLALEKYPWPIAILKIWKRVTNTCMQPGYHIDYP